MRILILNDYGFTNGGVETNIAAFRDSLRARGHHVHVFTSSAHPTSGLPLADSTCFGTTSRYRTLLQSCNPTAPLQLRRTLQQFQPDVIQLNDFLTQLSPLILPLLRPYPTVLYVQWPRVTCPTGTRTLPNFQPCHATPGRVCLQSCLPLRDWPVLLFQMRLWRRFQSHLTQTVAVSHHLAAHLQQHGFPPTPVIPICSPTNSTPRTLSPSPSLAFAGRLVPEKGVDILLHALHRILPQVPTAHLHIAGDGPQRPHLEQLTTQLGLTSAVTFHGWLPPASFPGQPWAVCVPSLWPEPFGMVAVEAAAAGLPALVAAHGGLPEIVTHQQTGLHVPPGDIDAWAQAMLTLLTQPSLATQLGDAARLRARNHFSLHSAVDQWLAIFSKISCNPSRPALL